MLCKIRMFLFAVGARRWYRSRCKGDGGGRHKLRANSISVKIGWEMVSLNVRMIRCQAASIHISTHARTMESASFNTEITIASKRANNSTIAHVETHSSTTI